MPKWVPDVLLQKGFFPRAASVAGWTYLVAALALIFLLAIPAVMALFGYRAYVIYGGSMGSALPNGSIAITRRIEPQSINVGDIVAIKKSARSLPVLHRVIGIDGSDEMRQFTTQGDANKEADPGPISLHGSGDRVVFSIPALGYLVHFARSGVGRALLLITPATLLVGVILWQTWKDVGKRPYFGEEPQC